MDADELKLESEKLKLERERLAIEKERIQAAQERIQSQMKAIATDGKGKLMVNFPTLILVSIICMLLGGILGAFSTTFSANLREKQQLSAERERLSDLVRTLEDSQPQVHVPVQPLAGTNRTGVAATRQQTSSSESPPLPSKPKGRYDNVSLIVIKGP
ncbi:MAG: hypothetical protein IKR48_01090 [Kiritimatiellae bacterium]|nr:hypothetical protein [Kiritimatiellia bacterium]